MKNRYKLKRSEREREREELKEMGNRIEAKSLEQDVERERGGESERE